MTAEEPKACRANIDAINRAGQKATATLTAAVQAFHEALHESLRRWAADVRRVFLARRS